MTDLIEFINKNTRSIQYNKIPTYSIHSTLAKKYINEIIADYPQYQNILEALICYPVQKWADETRKKLKLDEDNLNTIIQYETDEYFGIKNTDFLKKQKIILQISKEELSFMDSKLNNEILVAIHGYKPEHDISKYKMVEHYKQTVIEFCETNNDDYRKIIKPLISEYNKLDDDIQFVYHNASILLQTKSIINKYDAEICKKDEINYQIISQIIDKCIKQLNTYYISDKYIERVAMLYSDGNNEFNIAKIIGKSRTYVKNIKKDAIEAISYIIWGYTTHEIIYNCKETIN